jgi:hypothetical protein
MLQTRILIAYFIPTIKYTNSNVIKTFDFRIKDGSTCMWNQHRSIEFQNSVREHTIHFQIYGNPCALKKRTPQRVF